MAKAENKTPRVGRDQKTRRIKPRPRNTGKQGTKRTEWPDFACLPVKPFPIQAIAKPGDAPHDLGTIQTPEEMAKSVPPGGRWKEMTVDDAAAKALAALAGSGPAQTPPHFNTAMHLNEGLARLRDHVLAGDADAMKWLGFVLSHAVADLSELARRRPEIVRTWSRGQNVVPVLTGKNAAQTGSKSDIGQLRRDLDAFAVGEASPYKINPEAKRGGGTFNAATPVNALAGELLAHLDRHRFSVDIMKSPVPNWARMASVLPELTKASASKWTEAAWECLMSATGSQPEKFSNLGEARASEGPGAEREKLQQSLREAIARMAKERE